MRTTLTIEQSAELIRKGIPNNRASDFEAVSSTNPRGIGGQVVMARPIFTLADLLSLLPKHISFANAEWYLNIQWDILDNKWHVQYLDFDHYDEVVKEEEAPELIDALYMLTLAVINHVKLD